MNNFNNLVFLDTETTGNELLKDHLFQVCYKHNGNIVSEYFKPPLPISVKAQSVTHVTNKMVADKKPFEGSKMQKDLKELLKDNILVAHNAAFDIAILAQDGVTTNKFICTLKVARYLDENLEIPEHNLQYLRYHLELDVIAHAHDAKDDVMVLEALFKYQYGVLLEKLGSHEKAIEEMIRISITPFLYKKFTFGKHKGRKIEEVLVTDRSYLEWMLTAKTESGDEDWIYSLKHYLKS